MGPRRFGRAPSTFHFDPGRLGSRSTISNPIAAQLISRAVDSPRKAPTISSATAAPSQGLLQSVAVPPGVQALSVFAENGLGAPMQIVLLSPAGAVLGTTTSTNGIASLDVPVTDAGMYIAQDKGYLREQGLELEYVDFTTAAESIAPLGARRRRLMAGFPRERILASQVRRPA